MARTAEECTGPRSRLESAARDLERECPGITIIDVVVVKEDGKPTTWSAKFTIEGCAGEIKIGPYDMETDGSVANLTKVLRDIWKSAHDK